VPQVLPDFPQRFVGDREHGVPQRRFILTIEPVAPEMRREQLRHVGGNPRRYVYAVGDEVHRMIGAGR
jgi:hypothetical protein